MVTEQAERYSQTDPRLRNVARTYPDWWIEKVLGCRLWMTQKAIAQSVFHFPRTTVRSCSGSGKSFIAARIALAFLYHYPPATVITTAPTWRQVVEILWREIAVAFSGSKFPLDGSRTNARLDIAPDWFAIGLSTDEPERFQGLHNKNVLVIADEACFDDQTEVLTRKGWKLIKDLTASDTLLTASIKTWQGHYRKPKAIMEYQHDGEMYEINQRGCSLKVTPQHKCLVSVNQDYKENKWELREIQDISNRYSFYMKRDFKWVGSNRTTFEFPFTPLSHKRFNIKFVGIGDWAELLGWILSEGNIYGARGVDYGVNISQKSVSNRKKILELSARIGFVAHEYDREIHIQSAQLARVIKGYGHSCLDKFVPDYIKELPPEHIKRFLDSYFAGDGYTHEGRRIFYTSSKCMADDLQELILKTGRCASIQKRSIKGQRKFIIDHYATSSVDGYVVAEYKDNSFIKVRRSNIQKVHYVGKVYCVDLPPYHLLYVRRNGTCMWSGNSGLTSEMYGALENPLSTGNAHLLLIGNPTQSIGNFRETFDSPLYQKYRISAFDTPNFTVFGITEDDIRKNTWQLKIGGQPMPYPGLVSPQWVSERMMEWGEGSYLYTVYVKGDFPEAGVNNLFRLSDVENAMASLIRDDKAMKIGALDVARYGDDESCFVVRQGNRILDPQTWGNQDSIYTAGRTARLIKENKCVRVAVDAVGLGAGVYDILKHEGMPVVEFNSGHPALDKERYGNRRAEGYSELNQKLMDNELALPNSIKLKAQLTDIRFRYTPKGQLYIEDKEEAKARGSKSPDVADAIMMTMGKSRSARPNVWRY